MVEDPDFVGPPAPPKKKVPQSGDEFVGPPAPPKKKVPKEGDKDFVGPSRSKPKEEPLKLGDDDFVGPLAPEEKKEPEVTPGPPPTPEFELRRKAAALGLPYEVVKKVDEQQAQPEPSAPKKHETEMQSTWKPVSMVDIRRRKAEEEAYREEVIAKREYQPRDTELPSYNEVETLLIRQGMVNIAEDLYKKRTGIDLDQIQIRKSGEQREYLGKGRDISMFGFDREPTSETRPDVTHVGDIEKLHEQEPKKEPVVKSSDDLIIERKAGEAAGLTDPGTVYQKIQVVFQQREQEREAWLVHRRELDRYPHSRDIGRTVGHFIAGFPSFEYILGTSEEREKIVSDWEHSVWRAGYRPYGDDDMITRFTTGFTSAPLIQNVIIPLTIGMGMGIGSSYFGSLIAVKYGATASLIYKTSLAGTGGFFVGMAAGDVARTAIREEDPHEALVKALTYGLQFGSAAVGYKAGRQITIRGATPGEWGARRGYESRIQADIDAGRIDPEQGYNLLKISKLEFQLRKMYRGVMPDQLDPAFRDIQTLQESPELRAFFERHTLRRKTGIFGSASEGRAEIHDLDIMYRRGLGVAEARYAGTKTAGGDVSQYTDIKPWQRVGSQVGRLGTIKQPWYRTIGKYDLMRISESAMRHGESSLELAHIGRVKDIPRAVELYSMLHEAAGSPAKIQPILDEYKIAMAALEKNPLLMASTESEFIYGPSLTEKWWKFKTKVYEKVLPESWFERSYQITMGVNIPGAAPIVGLPPSPTMSFIPSPIISTIISSFIPSTESSQIPDSYESTITYEESSKLPSIKKSESPIISKATSESKSQIKKGSTSPSIKHESPSFIESPTDSMVKRYIGDSKYRSSISPSSVTQQISPFISSIQSGSSTFMSSSTSDIIQGAQSYIPIQEPEARITPGQAYDVFVKERYIFEGKKKRPERFEKMGGPLSFSDAHSLGATLADRSAAASFKVVPTSGEPKGLEVEVDPWLFLRHKFYRKDDINIEKTSHRIDTQGEREQITAKGILASLNKRRESESIFDIGRLTRNTGVKTQLSMESHKQRRSNGGSRQTGYDDVRDIQKKTFNALRKMRV